MMLRPLVILCALLGLCACVAPWPRLAGQARQAGLQQQQMRVNDFSHTLFFKAAIAPTSEPMVVFIEGDGRPWRNQGWQPNPEPRPHHALAFELMLQTPGPAGYLTRPCYDGSYHLPACTPPVWTDARYSAANVASMIAALRQFGAVQQVKQWVLVGYSGGGTLAVLMAAQMPEVVGVVTIAANLDTQAWTQAQQFSPLTGSMNPATQTSDLSVPHVALQGKRDVNVPEATLVGYREHHPSTQWWYIDDYDHGCCWQRDWRTLWPVIRQKLGLAE